MTPAMGPTAWWWWQGSSSTWPEVTSASASAMSFALPS